MSLPIKGRMITPDRHVNYLGAEYVVAAEDVTKHSIVHIVGLTEKRGHFLVRPVQDATPPLLHVAASTVNEGQPVFVRQWARVEMKTGDAVPGAPVYLGPDGSPTLKAPGTKRDRVVGLVLAKNEVRLQPSLNVFEDNSPAPAPAPTPKRRSTKKVSDAK